MRRLVALGIMLLLLLRFEILQGQNYIITNGQTITTCSGNFYDPGGPNGSYSSNQNITQTFITESSSQCLQVTFTAFHLESTVLSGPCDYLKIYDGTSTSSTLLGTFYGSNSPGTLTSTSGALTFVFHSDNSLNYEGWKATFSCVECPTSPPPLPQSPSPNPCEPNGIHPFCTDVNPYGVTFPSGMTGDASSFLGSYSYGCLSTTPKPAWYYMQISDPGDLLIYISQVDTTGYPRDVDFICWGPFEAASQSEFVENLCNDVYTLDNNHYSGDNGYPDGNVVDCSYSTATTEYCHINNAQQGEWYLLLLTNWSGYRGTISFNLVYPASTASTNCNLLAPIISNGPLCEGDTLELSCEPVAGNVTYNWSGPGGWSTSTTVPYVSIPNVTTSHSGQYSLYITGSSSSAETSHLEVLVRAMPHILLSTSSDTICEGESATLQVVAYNNNSHSFDFLWNTGDTTQSITVSDSGLYSISVINDHDCVADTSVWTTLNKPYHIYIDTIVCDSLVWANTVLTSNGEYTFNYTASNGCDSVVVIHLAIAENPIIDAYLPESMIAGDTLFPVVIGTQVGANLQYATPQNTLCHEGRIHLPDGIPCEPYGCSYHDTLNFSGFPDTAVIGSANDIHYIRLNMEHSYVRDLYINLTCPNGQKSVILKKVTTTSFSSCLDQIPTSDRGWKSGNNITGQALLGLAYVQYDVSNRCDSTLPKNRPGTGWNYCWSSDTVDGYLYAPGEGSLLYRSVHAHYQSVLGHTYKVIDSSNVAAKSQFYHPDESFDSLVGCPINGTWTIEVMDGITAHNGYLFSWGISLTDHLAPNHYLPVTEKICSGPWVTPVTDSTYIINPPNTLTHDTLVAYTFTLIDEIGCAYDTTLYIHVYVRRDTTLYDTVYAADLPWTWQEPEFSAVFSSPGTQSFTIPSVHGTDSTITLHLSVIYPSDTIFCGNDLPVDWHGYRFTKEDTTATIFYPVDGADSIEMLSVSILPTSTDTVVKSACSEYTWHGFTYRQSGEYSFDTLNMYGCDSTTILKLTIFTPDTIQYSHTACDRYTWHDVTYSQSGEYTFDTVNIHDCDSTVILQLTINSSDTTYDSLTTCNSYTWHNTIYYQSGEYHFDTINIHDCDSTVILQLTINSPDTTYDSLTTCSSYTWHNTTYSQSGEYTFDTVNIHGCDSTVIFQLTINSPDTTYDSLTACGSYIWHNTTYYQSGKYNFDTVNIQGCDSTVIFQLTINSPDTTYDSLTACGSYIWHNSTYYQSGEYHFDTINIHDCDSTVILQLTINSPDTTSIFDTAYKHFTWHGSTYYQSGEYNFDTVNIHDCDSTVILNLTIFSPDTISRVDSACLEYEWHNSIYYQSGEYFFDTLNIYGYDSTTVLYLTIFHPDTISISDTACGSFSWHNSTYYQSGEYHFDTVNIHGCDSIEILQLTIFHPDTTPIIFDTACGSFTWHNTTYYQSGEYHFDTVNIHGCDSVEILQLTLFYPDTTRNIIDTACGSYTWHNSTYYQSGEYHFDTINIHGCDSIVILQLTIFTPDTTSIFDTVYEHFTWHGSTYYQSGEYHFDTVNIHNCDSTVILNLTINNYPNVTQSFDTTVCATSLPIDWRGHTFTSADSVSDTLQTIHLSDSLVTYILHVDSIIASVSAVTHVNCYGDSTGAVTGSVSGGIAPYSYQWANLSEEEVSSALQVIGLHADTFTFTVTDSLGCISTDTATVKTLHDKMVPGSIADNQSLCDGETLQEFTGTVAQGGDNSVYQWQISVAEPSGWDEAPGVHNLQNYTFSQNVTEPFFLRRAWISQNCGTRYSDTLSIQLWPIHRDTINDHVCQNQPYTDNGFNLTAEQTSVPGLLTLENSLPTSHCDSFIVLQLNVLPTFEKTIEDEVCEGSGYYEHGFNISAFETTDADTLQRRLVLQSTDGCDSTLELHLNVIDTAVQIILLSPDFCENQSAELTVESALTEYLWNNGDQTALITVTEPGTYSVTASQGDCYGIADFVVESCDFQIYLPNAISPNNPEGLNDYFCIPEYYQKFIDNFEIRVFNRWGDQVFYSTDKNFKWNGEYKGQIYHQNIYNYVIHYTSLSGTPFVITGSVTVL